MADRSSDIKLKRLARYVKEDPDDSFSKFALALELLKRDELNRARILFESVRDKDPEYTGVYYHLGKLYQRIGRITDAAQTYKRGIEIAKNKGETRTETELKEVLAELEYDLE